MKIRFIIYLFVIIILTACTQANQQDSATAVSVQEEVPTVMSSPTPTPEPTFSPTRFGTAELEIPYCSPGHPLQKLDLYFPESGGPWPVIAYVHGGSWIEGDKAEGEGWRGLNDSGYLVASINYRMAADGKFPVMIEDVKCAIRYLRAHSAEYNIDPERIGAVGASAGGHLVALLGLADESAGWDEGDYSEKSSAVTAVITMSGLSDFTVKMPSGINSSIYYAFGKLAGSDSPENVAASPVTYIDANDPPFLILHGDNDGVVPVEQAQILQERLSEAGVPSTLIIVNGGDHGLQGPDASPTQAEISEIISNFWEKHLK